MKTNTSIAVWAIGFCSISISSLCAAGVGADTSAAMTKYYNDVRPYCQSSSAPAFMCSGILLRATVPSPNYHSWNPSPASVASGGVSFSYLRADATFSKLAYGHNNGFTLTPYNYAPEGTIEPDILCSFPVDATTNQRLDKGCGDSTNTVEPENYCQVLGITTAELWQNAYFSANKNNNRQCGFDVRDSLNTKGAQSFYESLRAMSLIKPLPASTQNELRLATWAQNAPLPIQSFFYTTDGLADAQADQADWFSTNGTYVPIIAITLPATAASTAQFNYFEGDQTVCETYIQSGSWVKRHDPGINKEAWTLEVTPTQCGRQIKDNQTSAAYAELVQKYGNAPQWNEENGGGMRRQLVCHYIIARNKPTWNLEPFRPDVTNRESIDAGCNPVPSASVSANDSFGMATANAMSMYYADTRPNCGSSSSPAFMCSGILMRGTESSPAFHAWNPSPSSKRSGGVSFSYLRADAPSIELLWPNGFTFFPYNFAPDGAVEPEVLCSFPMDADTLGRLDSGCGDIAHTPLIEKTCQEHGVTTAEGWKTLLDSGIHCGFDVRDARDIEGAKAFYESLRARQLPIVGPDFHSHWNELMLATWPDNIPYQLPIQAFFYVPPGAAPLRAAQDGLLGAQSDQQDWYNTTGKFLPIIAVTLPTAAEPTAKFVYNKTDQVVF
ncbi:DUF2599 domain-containing protein [Pseudomonas sp. DWP3-1-2]|uniref:DUF2599 domain-containing protein n=1 Tax=Pseudomonas sp. DWP3-1-2 TaxID=2804645 RepID=UPI003CE95012